MSVCVGGGLDEVSFSGSKWCFVFCSFYSEIGTVLGKWGRCLHARGRAVYPAPPHGENENFPERERVPAGEGQNPHVGGPVDAEEGGQVHCVSRNDAEGTLGSVPQPAGKDESRCTPCHPGTPLSRVGLRRVWGGPVTSTRSLGFPRPQSGQGRETRRAQGHAGAEAGPDARAAAARRPGSSRGARGPLQAPPESTRRPEARRPGRFAAAARTRQCPARPARPRPRGCQASPPPPGPLPPAARGRQRRFWCNANALQPPSREGRTGSGSAGPRGPSQRPPPPPATGPPPPVAITTGPRPPDPRRAGSAGSAPGALGEGAPHPGGLAPPPPPRPAPPPRATQRRPLPPPPPGRKALAPPRLDFAEFITHLGGRAPAPSPRAPRLRGARAGAPTRPGRRTAPRAGGGEARGAGSPREEQERQEAGKGGHKVAESEAGSRRPARPASGGGRKSAPATSRHRRRRRRERKRNPEEEAPRRHPAPPAPRAPRAALVGHGPAERRERRLLEEAGGGHQEDFRVQGDARNVSGDRGGGGAAAASSGEPPAWVCAPLPGRGRSGLRPATHPWP